MSWAPVPNKPTVSVDVKQHSTKSPWSQIRKPCGYAQYAVRIMPDRFGSVLPKKARIILCKTGPDPIGFWLTVSGFGLTDSVRKQAGVQDSSGPFLANASEPIRIGCESDPSCLLGIPYTPQCVCSFRTLRSASARFVRSTVRVLVSYVLVSYTPQCECSFRTLHSA